VVTSASPNIELLIVAQRSESGTLLQVKGAVFPAFQHLIVSNYV
jgi:hypothetical protein